MPRTKNGSAALSKRSNPSASPLSGVKGNSKKSVRTKPHIQRSLDGERELKPLSRQLQHWFPKRRKPKDALRLKLGPEPPCKAPKRPGTNSWPKAVSESGRSLPILNRRRKRRSSFPRADVSTQKGRPANSLHRRSQPEMTSRRSPPILALQKSKIRPDTRNSMLNMRPPKRHTPPSAIRR